MMRAQAEALVRRNPATLENLAALSPEQMRTALHELRVSQVQLEMQNEELRSAQLALVKRYLAALSTFPFTTMFRGIIRDGVRLNPHRR